jgi:hypothetical protein
VKALERMHAIRKLTGVSSTEKAVLWSLALFVAGSDDACFPSYESIGKSAGLTTRGAMKAVRALVERGLVVSSVRRTDQGRRTSNTYVLNLSANGPPGVNGVHSSEPSSHEQGSPLSSERRSSLKPVEGCTTFTDEGEPRSPPEGEPRSPDLIREDLIIGTKERSREDASSLSLSLEVVSATPKSKRVRRSRANDVRAIFDAWAEARQKRHPRDRAVLDPKRTKCIEARLAVGFDVETLKLAVAGIWLDPFNLGENDRGREYTDIGLALRDAAHVEKFAALARVVRETPDARGPLASVSRAAVTPRDAEESARLLRDGRAAFDAKLEADRKAFEGGARAARG